MTAFAEPNIGVATILHTDLDRFATAAIQLPKFVHRSIYNWMLGGYAPRLGLTEDTAATWKRPSKLRIGVPVSEHLPQGDLGWFAGHGLWLENHELANQRTLIDRSAKQEYWVMSRWSLTTPRRPVETTTATERYM